MYFSFGKRYLNSGLRKNSIFVSPTLAAERTKALSDIEDSKGG